MIFNYVKKIFCKLSFEKYIMDTRIYIIQKQTLAFMRRFNAIL